MTKNSKLRLEIAAQIFNGVASRTSVKSNMTDYWNIVVETTLEIAQHLIDENESFDDNTYDC